jgi:hypothetical protein
MSLMVFLADDHAGVREARPWQPNSPIAKVKDSPLKLSRFPDRQEGYFP